MGAEAGLRHFHLKGGCGLVGGGWRERDALSTAELQGAPSQSFPTELQPSRHFQPHFSIWNPQAGPGQGTWAEGVPPILARGFRTLAGCGSVSTHAVSSRTSCGQASSCFCPQATAQSPTVGSYVRASPPGISAEISDQTHRLPNRAEEMALTSSAICLAGDPLRIPLFDKVVGVLGLYLF